MRRHGWALCLGLLLGGTAAAQPPADLERYPPAPDRPGTAVGRPSPRPVATAAGLPVRPTGVKPAGGQAPMTPPTSGPALAYPAAPTVTIVQPAEPLPAPDAKAADAPKATEAPAKPTTDAAAAPADPLGHAPAAPAATACAPEGPYTMVGCSCVWRIKDWLCFRSRSRQSGCYPSQPWPMLLQPCCEPKICATCAPPAKCPGLFGKCGGGKCAEPVVGPVVGPVVDPVPATLPVMPAPAEPMPPKGAAKADPLFPPGTVVATGPDELSGFRKVDVGLSFAPGAAPMAHPTTQVERVSNWRPK